METKSKKYRYRYSYRFVKKWYRCIPSSNNNKYIQINTANTNKQTNLQPQHSTTFYVTTYVMQFKTLKISCANRHCRSCISASILPRHYGDAINITSHVNR